MQKLIINGNHQLNGEVTVQGAKNSVLPIIAASLLINGQSVIHNCPKITDVACSVKILQALGCKVKCEENTIIIDSSTINSFEIPDNLMREMRSSIVFMGAILSRFNKAKVSFPGGCCLGSRPIDIHLSALQSMGVDIVEQHGFIECYALNGLIGSQISLPFPSVGATENIILAAAMAKGETIILNAAREPEIDDLIDFLNKCGASISNSGAGMIKIVGVDKLFSVEHTIIPDRIVTATYMAAVGSAKGDVVLNNVNCQHMMSIIPYCIKSGCEIKQCGNQIRIKSNKRLSGLGSIRTMPYPGFPTDAQAPIMVMAALAKGTSIIIETIFDNRFKHIGELMRMGADIKTEGRVAIIEGVSRLWGASVQAEELRGAAALVIAGLAADGITEITGIEYLDRGYEQIEDNLNALGASVKRIK